MRRDQNGAGSAASSCHLSLSFEAHTSFEIPETQVFILAPFSHPDALRRRRNIIILPVFKVLQSGWGKQLYSAANAWPTRRPVSPLLLFWGVGGIDSLLPPAELVENNKRTYCMTARTDDGDIY